LLKHLGVRILHRDRVQHLQRPRGPDQLSVETVHVRLFFRLHPLLLEVHFHFHNAIYIVFQVFNVKLFFEGQRIDFLYIFHHELSFIFLV